MPRPLTNKALENAAMRTLFLIVKGKLDGRDAMLRLKAAVAVLQAQKKLGTGSRASPAPDETLTLGEEDSDIPELKGMSDKELRELVGEE